MTERTETDLFSKSGLDRQTLRTDDDDEAVRWCGDLF